jgi:hypothetical protein
MKHFFGTRKVESGKSQRDAKFVYLHPGSAASRPCLCQRGISAAFSCLPQRCFSFTFAKIKNFQCKYRNARYWIQPFGCSFVVIPIDDTIQLSPSKSMRWGLIVGGNVYTCLRRCFMAGQREASHGSYDSPHHSVDAVDEQGIRWGLARTVMQTWPLVTA